MFIAAALNSNDLFMCNGPFRPIVAAEQREPADMPWINGWIGCVGRSDASTVCTIWSHFNNLCFDGDCQHETANEIEWRSVWNVACSTLIISTEAFQNSKCQINRPIFPRRPEKSHPTSMSWLFLFMLVNFMDYAMPWYMVRMWVVLARYMCRLIVIIFSQLGRMCANKSEVFFFTEFKCIQQNRKSIENNCRKKNPLEK